MNGLVDGTRAVFYATGSPAEVESFLVAVCENLCGLPLDRLEQERQVLLTEGYARAPVVAPHVRMRYGATGFGSGTFGELGLHCVDAGEVRTWAEQRFNRHNAAVWMTCEPSSDLALRLPAGERHGVPPPRVIRSVRLPAYSSEGPSGVAFSWVGKRSTALGAASCVAGLTAEERLRRRQGLSYAIAPSYDPLDAELSHCGLFADTLPASAGVVRDTLLGVVDEIAAGNADEGDLREHVRRAVRSLRDPTRVGGALDAAATNELTGAQSWTPEELVEETEALRPQDLGEAIAPALESLLVTLPSGVGIDRARFHHFAERPEHVRIEGESFHRASAIKRLRGAQQELTIGADGVSFVQPAGDVVTVRFEDCVAVTDEGDGIRLHDADGGWGFIRFISATERERVTGLLEAKLPQEF